jgi:hypothetical protein
MYWKARSRVAWRLEVENQDGGEKLIKATIQKRSNLPYIEPIYYRVYFDSVSMDALEPGMPPIEPSVRMKIVDQQEIAKETPIDEAILSALMEEGELTTSQLMQFSGRNQSNVYRALTGKLKDKVTQKKVGKSVVWKLR